MERFASLEKVIHWFTAVAVTGAGGQIAYSLLFRIAQQEICLAKSSRWRCTCSRCQTRSPPSRGS